MLAAPAGPAPAEAEGREAAERAMTGALELYEHGTAGDYQAALDTYRQVLDTWRRLGDGEQQAETLYMAGKCLRQLGRGREALASFHQALTLQRPRGDRRAIARTVIQVGIVHLWLGDYEAALAAHREVLELSRALGDVARQASTLNNIGVIHRRSGRLRQALTHYQEALFLFRQTGEEEEEATALLNIAGIHNRLGEPRPAFDSYRQALDRFRALGDRDGEAKTLNNLGNLHLRLGEPQEALTHFQQALAIFRQLGHPLAARTLHNLGFLRHRLGQSERGLEMLEQALALQRRVEDRTSQAATLTEIASVRAALGEMTAARDLLLQALELRSQVPDPAGEAWTRSVLGAVYAESGDGARAREHLVAALAAQRQLGDRRGEAVTLRHLGGVRAAAGDLETAHDALKESAELCRATGLGHTLAWALRDLARLELARGRPQLARRHLETALGQMEASSASLLDAELRTAFFGSRQPVHELYVDVLMGLAREAGDGGTAAAGLLRLAFEASERARARRLVELLSESRYALLRRVDPDLAAHHRDLRRRINAAAALGTGRAESAASEEASGRRQTLRRLLDDLRRLEVEIRRRHPGYASLLEPPRIRVADVQERLLDPRTMLLEFALGRERSYLWAVTATELQGFVLPPRAEIEALGRAAYEQLGTLTAAGGERRCELLAALGDTLLGPVAGKLGDRRLVVVPDGVLHYLPFAAFADPRSPAAGACARPPLVARHEVVTLPSAAAVLELRSRLRGRSPAPGTVAVLADPVFRADDPRVTAAAEPGDATALRTAAGEAGFVRLAWSRREARAIADLVAPEELFAALDFAASRDVLDHLGRYRVVHFATHSFLDSRHPELSGLALSLVDEGGRPRDGFLRLHDVYTLDLRAELVVLSGCRTALGREIRGEGLVGLTRGFFYAGSARVLASLWRVDDRATAELMGRFYRSFLKRGATPAAALRRAQLELRRERRWRDPYYWAGFVLQGDWTATPPEVG